MALPPIRGRAPPVWRSFELELQRRRLSLAELRSETSDSKRAAALNPLELHVWLPQDQVDMLIAAGHYALQSNWLSAVSSTFCPLTLCAAADQWPLRAAGPTTTHLPLEPDRLRAVMLGCWAMNGQSAHWRSHIPVLALELSGTTSLRRRPPFCFQCWGYPSRGVAR